MEAPADAVAQAWRMVLGPDFGSQAPCHRDVVLGAASGDLDCLRSLTAAAYDRLGNAADHEVASAAWVEALAYARLAAARHEARDAEVFVFLLAKFADWQRERGRHDIATCFEASGLNLAAELADAGDESFAEMVERAAGVLSAETIEEAARQRAAHSRGLF